MQVCLCCYATHIYVRMNVRGEEHDIWAELNQNIVLCGIGALLSASSFPEVGVKAELFQFICL